MAWRLHDLVGVLYIPLFITGPAPPVKLMMQRSAGGDLEIIERVGARVRSDARLGYRECVRHSDR